jgi:hypothetical protein
MNIFDFLKIKLKRRSISFNIGDSIIVRKGTLDPDFGFDISEWQGRIKELDSLDSVLIEWDSITLSNMDFNILVKCEIDDLDWKKMSLLKSEIEKSTPRDSDNDVKMMAQHLFYRLRRDRRVLAAEAD